MLIVRVNDPCRQRGGMRGLWTAVLASVGLPLATPAAPATELIEIGAPPYRIISLDALNLTGAPRDINALPDGRILVSTADELSFGDGERWSVARVSTGEASTPLFELAVSDDQRFFAGSMAGVDELYFDPSGDWRRLPRSDWQQTGLGAFPLPRSVSMENGAWLWHSESGPVVRWTPGQEAELAGQVNTVSCVFQLGDWLYISDQTDGRLHRFRGTEHEIVPSPAPMIPSDAITASAAFGTQNRLIGTRHSGLHRFDGSTREPFSLRGFDLSDQPIMDLIALPDDRFAALVPELGVFVFDRNGNVRVFLDAKLDNRLRRPSKIVSSPGGKLWVLLDDGVLVIETASGLQHFEHLIDHRSRNLVAARLEGRLALNSDGQILVGRYDGLGRLIGFADLTPAKHWAHTLTTTTPVPLMSSDQGTFAWKKGAFEMVAPGLTNLRVFAQTPQQNRWIYSADDEFGWLEWRDGKLITTPQAFPGLQSYMGVVDAAGNHWLELGTGRMARISRKDSQLACEIFDERHGLPPSWLQLFVFDGVLHVNAIERCFVWNEKTQRIQISDTFARNLPQNKEVTGRPVFDSLGRLWLSDQARAAVFETGTSPWQQVKLTTLAGFVPIYFLPESEGRIWMSDGARLLRFDPSTVGTDARPLRATFTRVKLLGSERTLAATDPALASLSSTDNTLIPEFVADGSSLMTPIEFEVMLEPVDSKWISTGRAGSAIFNRLPAGEYVLRVRPTASESIGTEDQLVFRILPPWYRTSLAYFGYGLLSLGLVGGAIWGATVLGRRENLRLEGLVKRRTRELKDTNDQLEEQVEEIRILSQAINQSPVSVLITQHDGTILFANPKACELTGYLEQDLVGRRAESLRDFPEVSHPFAEIEDRLRKGETWTGELTNRHADGHIVHVRSTISPIRNADNSVRFHLILEEDITGWLAEQDRHHRLEDQLFQARKLESIGTLAGGIAHDFNNILTGILGHCEIALLDTDPRSQLAADLNDIRKSGHRARDLVSQILTFSRKAESTLEPINLAEPVEEALKLVRASTPSIIEIVQHLEPGVVMADATQIHQIVLNLCTNAAHAIADKPGRISVELKHIDLDDELRAEIPGMRSGDHMLLTVTDNGTGMDAAVLERIFDPFFTTKEQGKGTGLGLSTVQGIMANHQGAHRVRSSPGVGTTFELFFPATSIVVCPKSEIREPIEDGASREVLVVDDETTVVQFVATRLQQFGYVPCAFTDPREALAAVRSTPARFEAIVTDLTMPYLTGADLVQRVREAGSTIPAIVITGYGRENALEKLHTLSNTYVLGKPFAGNELARLLGRAIRSSLNPHD